MRFQSSASSCGLACIRNSLLTLGIERTEDELATLARYTPTDGTDHRGMLRALRAIGTEPAELKESRADVALMRLEHAIRRGRPAILCVDNWDHWVVAFGLMGETFHICDSAHNELVLHYKPADLLQRWQCAGRRQGFYGIVV